MQKKRVYLEICERSSFVKTWSIFKKKKTWLEQYVGLILAELKCQSKHCALNFWKDRKYMTCVITQANV